MKTISAEVWVVCDSSGDYATGGTAEEARESYETNVGALADADGFRMVKLLVNVPLPEVSVVSLTASAPALDAVTAAAG